MAIRLVISFFAAEQWGFLSTATTIIGASLLAGGVIGFVEADFAGLVFSALGRCFGGRPTATLRANFRAHPKAETIAAARALGLANIVRQKAVSPVDLILQNPMLVIDEVRDAFR